MKILSITYEYPPIGGGGAVVASALNETLTLFGDTIEVVTSAMPRLAHDESVDNVRVHRTACWRRHRHYTTTAELATTLIPAYRKAVEVVERFRPDIIHTHFVIPSGAVGSAVSRRFGIPQILTAHGSDMPGYNPDRFQLAHWLLRPAWRRIIDGAAAVTSPSRFLAGLVRDVCNAPVTVLPNGYTPAPRQGRQKRNLVLVVARLFPRKGVQHFIDSLRGLPDGWEFVVAGDGPYLSSLKQRSSRLGAAVRFVGFIDKTTLRGLYEEASILVFPSIRENFPMVLLEGMDAGCAVITTDAEGCAEVVGDAGIAVPRGNAGEIHAALAQLMTDSGERERLAEAAKRRVRQFRWPLIANQFRQLYAEVSGIAMQQSYDSDELARTGMFSSVRHHPASPTQSVPR